MKKYDYFVAGRWRNRDQIKEVVRRLRDMEYRVYCFIENNFDGDGIFFSTDDQANPDAMMEAFEKGADWQANPTFRQIFEADMQALRESMSLVLVFPAGLAAHMELGAAYGMGMACYGIGVPVKPETLYLMFDAIHPDLASFCNQVKVKSNVP